MNGLLAITAVVDGDAGQQIEVSVRARYTDGQRLININYFMPQGNIVDTGGLSVEAHKRVTRAVEDLLTYIPEKHVLDKVDR